MNPSRPPRRFSRDVVRAAAVVVAAVFAVSVAQAVRHRDSYVSAIATGALPLAVQTPLTDPVSPGAPLASGDPTTAFALVPPAGASCAGDTATGGYHINSYIVPVTVDPSALTWNSTGPVPLGTGAALRLPLFSTTGAKYVNGATAVATGGNPVGLVVGVPDFSFNTFQTQGGSTVVPDGSYNIGLACTTPTANVVDKYWNVVVTVTAVAGQLNWVVGTGTPPTTTTSSTTTTSTTVAPTTSPSTSTTTSTTTTSTTTTSTTIAPTTTTSTTIAPTTTTSTTIAPTTTTSTTIAPTTSTSTTTTVRPTTTTSSTTSTTIAPTTSTSTTTTVRPTTTTSSTTTTTVRPTTTTSSPATTTTVAGGTTTTTVQPHEHERECRKFNKRRGDRCEPRTNLPWFRVLGL